MTRVYFAGASGVIGGRLVPLLVDAGYTVGAMTRTPEKAARLAATGAEPIICDVFDRTALTRAVRRFEPDLLLHELTDLPDDRESLPAESLLNARIRAEGTRNLLDVKGVVLRYGMFYGPGTYFEVDLPAGPRVHIDTAVARTLAALDAAPGILTVVDDDGTA